jgi:hypothetical protein
MKGCSAGDTGLPPKRSLKVYRMHMLALHYYNQILDIINLKRKQKPHSVEGFRP